MGGVGGGKKGCTSWVGGWGFTCLEGGGDGLALRAGGRLLGVEKAPDDCL